MKAKFLKLAAVFALAGLVLISASSALKSTGISEFVPSSLLMRNNFYFRKGQWLADTRTAIAAIQFLCRSPSSGSVNTSNFVNNSFLPFSRLNYATNLLGLEEIGTAILSHERRLSRADSLIIRTRLPSSFALAAADSNPSNGVVRAEEKLRRDTPQPTNASVPAMGSFSGALPVSGA
ncbi:MAG TPA: hypothetical protein VGO67_20560 [Verrucomicrobiae bacterium]|jgi:hypothetical protein